MTDFIEIDNLKYFPEDDKILFCKENREVSLSDNSWVSGSLLHIPNSLSYYIDGISWPIYAILPHKLEYLGFKDYKIRKQKLLIKKFNFRKTKEPKLVSEETYTGHILEFYNDADYS